MYHTGITGHLSLNFQQNQGIKQWIAKPFLRSRRREPPLTLTRSIPCSTSSASYPSRAFRKVNHYVLKRMARFLNRKSQRYYRLKFADTYYGEMTHYGLHRLAWADVSRIRN